MPTIVPPGFAEVAIELRATGDPDPWYITFGVETEAGGNYNLVGLAVMTAFEMMLQPMWSGVSLTGVKLQVGQDGPDNIQVYVPSTTTRSGGRGAPGFLPQNCALLVRKNSALGGRRNRGRFFVPLILAEGDVTNVGIIEPGSLPVFQDAAEAFFDELSSYPDVPLTMVILHGSEGVTAPGPPTVVTSLTVDPVIATQRRRLR